MIIALRRATKRDADAAVALLRRSITELCVADHHGDAAALADWLANKTAESWTRWLGTPDAFTCAAESGGRLVGVCMIRGDGEILLNYVLPEARFSGVSSAMLAAMETWAQRQGLSACTLETTRTARDFYAARGYGPNGGGTDDLRLRKPLAPAPD